MNNDILVLRILVRAREDFQAQRKRMDNRIGRKADGTDQAIDERPFIESDLKAIVDISEGARDQEKEIEKKLKKMLNRFPIYTGWLEGVKGVGTITAAHIISTLDIEEATTVSKMWQYCGMNPGQVKGKKRVEKGDSFEIVTTDTLVRGDKPTPGFVLPYNKTIKTVLLGVLADGFIKAQAPYAIDYYYPYKERLSHSEKTVMHGAKGKQVATAWKDVNPGRRDRAAKRYMIKMFLKDLYVMWRCIEGLPVRESYQEEYLGHKHTGY